MTLLRIGKDLIDVDESLRELDRLDCEESLAHFLSEFWKYIDPAPFQQGWVVDALCEHLEAIVDGTLRHTIFNIPPRSLKSSLCSVAFPAWTWAQRWRSHTSGPGVKFLHASYADKLSVRDSVKCRRIIESPRYKELWGDRFNLSGDQNAKHRFSNDKGGERLITSIGAGVTGEGGDCFVSGTRVETLHGYKSIEDIVIGDAVLAFDHSRDKVVTSRVIATREIMVNELCEIHTVSGRSIKCTGDHPIFSPGRRYIRANQLGRGDRLLVRHTGKGAAKTGTSSDLRQLRQRNGETTFRDAQGPETRKPGRLLQSQMFPSASRRQEFDGSLSHMRKAIAGATRALLLRGMQDQQTLGGGLRSLAHDLFSVWSRIFQQEKVLLAGLCRQSAFSSDAGGQELTVYRQSGLWSFASGNVGNNPRARWAQMRRLQASRQASEAQRRDDEISSAYASLGRESSPQYAGQPDYAVHRMPHETPSGQFDAVASVERYSGGPVSVYDIQVETQSNFFANGILAHNCIIIDDPNAANEVESAATIESTLEWWRGTMPTRLNDARKSVYIVIQQRLAENDLTGEILETQSEDWTHVMIPARYEPERSFVTSIGWKDPREEAGELYWPERFGEAELAKLEKQLGKWRASGQLQQRPEPKGGGIIQRDYWQTWAEDAFPAFSFIVASLDTAYTEKTENDPSALTVWGIFSEDTTAQAQTAGQGITVRTYAQQTPKVMLMTAWAERLEIHKLVKKVAETCKKMKCDKLLIENKASGQSVGQELRRLYNHEPWSVQLVDPRGQDKTARLHSVAPIWEAGLVWAPDRTWSDMVITEMASFPKGKHDDLTDTASQAIRHIRDLGLLQFADEIQAEVEEEMRYKPQPKALYPS